MNYYVARDGKQYGPYSTETVQRYLAEGSLLPADSAREETAQSWVTLAQLFPQGAPAAPPPVAPAPPAVTVTMPAMRPISVVSAASAAPVAPVTAQLIPPSLHWALVLLFNIVTFGFFSMIWIFVQSTWVHKIDPQSKATKFAAGGLIAVLMGAFVLGIGIGMSQDNADAGVPVLLFADLVMLVGSGFMIASFFSTRRSLVAYYNSVEPIQLKMSGVMTFFFTVFYIQYHLTRIANWKRTGVLTT